MINAAQFRQWHNHAVACNPQILDAEIEEEIAAIAEEYGFDINSADRAQQRAIGNAVCHIIQLRYPLDINQGMAGRISSIANANDRVSTNAKAMLNPSDWPSTGCGGLFARYLSTSTGGIIGFSGCCD